MSMCVYVYAHTVTAGQFQMSINESGTTRLKHNTPVSMARIYFFPETHIHLFKITAGADPNLGDADRCTPLHCAAQAREHTHAYIHTITYTSPHTDTRAR